MKWFVRGDGNFRFWWDMAIILCTTYSVWKIPMKVAFDPPSFDSYGLTLLDSLIDFYYLTDVLVSFRTTNLDLLTGYYVTDSYKIAAAYLGSGRFFLDILSSIPWDTITGISQLNALGLLKIQRY